MLPLCRNIFSSYSSSASKLLLKRVTVVRSQNQIRHLCCTVCVNSMNVVEDIGMPKDASIATVSDVYDLSANVKGLKLLVENRDFSFHPGQWVDVFIPNEPLVAGFSMCSSPKLLQETRHIELAVKLSKFPPVQWIHNKCVPGSQVGLRVGGDFYYKRTSPVRDLLLIAGGVGVNPLMSILRHVADCSSDHPVNGQIVLMYSARTTDDFIFQSDIHTILKANKNIAAKFFITRQSPKTGPKCMSGVDVFYQRINGETLKSVLQSSFNALSDVDCYICGPNKMIDAIDVCLIEIGLSEKQIRFEKWW